MLSKILAIFTVTTLILSSPFELRAQELGTLEDALREIRSQPRLAARAACRGKAKWRKPFCDGDKDWGSNREERRWHTKKRDADTDDDGVPDGIEVKYYKSDPLDPMDDGGAGSDTPGADEALCTAQGDTHAFGIPSGVIGNIGAGEQAYAATCLRCHSEGNKGEGYAYPRLRAATRSAPMFLTQLSEQTLSHLVAYLNRAQCPTPGQPDPGTGNPAPSSTPSVSPTPQNSPSPSPTPGRCTSMGDTTDFGIPAGMIGNISAGQTAYSANCASCHADFKKGEGWIFEQLKSVTRAPPMSLTGLTDQTLAHLVAFLNRAYCNGDSTPTPTPTSADPLVRGLVLYQGKCSSCHAKASEFSELTRKKLNEALREEKKMQGISLTEQEFSDLLQYFHSLAN
jgi:mono/diheme cytochrome c family protein